VLPYVVSFLQPAVPEAARGLAQAMDTTEHALARSIWELGTSVGTPAGLRSVGIRADQLPLLAEASLDRRLPSPRPLEYDALHQVLHAAWTGEPPGA